MVVLWKGIKIIYTNDAGQLPLLGSFGAMDQMGVRIEKLPLQRQRLSLL